MTDRCRHERMWNIGAGLIEWCHDCGAYRNPPSSIWIEPTYSKAAPELYAAIRNSDDAHWTPAMRAAMAKVEGRKP